MYESAVLAALGSAVGFAASPWLIRVMSPGAIRACILAISAISGIALALNNLAFLPGFLVWTSQLLREQRQLELAQSMLQPQEQNAAKLRASLDAVATATAKLAADGNANARVLVEELRKRGVTINPPDTAKPP